ncbi:hypothetical protein [Desulfoluna butyratoxydans]|uniref:DUF4381 domain-containing protein n=1 Tax=Desulfoluna butyratoxydans TaxID=231438 RepID=A0A4U8YRV8_9BACT|nr:hypothetical protein [Desulfoluna butyratoxydans]VFQ47066.1 hypothetical protein MSL71_47520 [Desulfoluna butyratoxydans]
MTSPIQRILLALLLMLGLAVTCLHAEEASQPIAPPAADSRAIAPQAPDKAPMTDIHDIAPPRFTGLSSGVKKAMLYGGIVLGVVILVLIGLWLWFRRKQGPKKAPEIYQPPDALALMALDRIEALMGQDGKAFYFELSETAKHYLKGRFGLDAPEMTVEELLPALSGLPVSPEQKKTVSGLFTHAEPVKFAGLAPDAGIMAEDFSAIRRFVTDTAQKPDEDASHND